MELRLFLVACLSILLVCWYRRWAQANDVRLVARTPIGEATAGYVHVLGKARAIGGRRLRDPVADRECLLFRIETTRLETIRDKGQRQDSWVPVKEACTSREFDIDDGTGVCRIAPLGAECGINEYEDVMVGKLRHRIWRIREGDQVFVFGQLQRETGDAGPVYRIERPGRGRAWLISTREPLREEKRARVAAALYLIGAVIVAGAFVSTLL